MPLRILIQNVIPEGDLGVDTDVNRQVRVGQSIYMEGKLRHAKMVCRPDTEITQRWADKYSGSIRHLYLATVNNLSLVNQIIKAEEEGFDAVVVGCHADCGVQIARSVVHIPVIGPTEASLAVAHFIGEKFALITIDEQYFGLLEQHIRMFGFEDRFIKHRPVRCLEEWIWPYMIDALDGKPEGLIALFEKTALECIRDGADTVLVPGYPFGTALSLAGYREVANTGATMVDGTAAALKMAEILADLHHSIGLTRTEARRSQYHQIPREFVDRALQGFVR